MAVDGARVPAVGGETVLSLPGLDRVPLRDVVRSGGEWGGEESVSVEVSGEVRRV